MFTHAKYLTVLRTSVKERLHILNHFPSQPQCFMSMGFSLSGEWRNLMNLTAPREPYSMMEVSRPVLVIKMSKTAKFRLLTRCTFQRDLGKKTTMTAGSGLLPPSNLQRFICDNCKNTIFAEIKRLNAKVKHVRRQSRELIQSNPAAMNSTSTKYFKFLASLRQNSMQPSPRQNQPSGSFHFNKSFIQWG